MRMHNQILLSYKQFVYEHRKIKHSINITEFWKYLKTVYKIELEIVKRITNLHVTIENGKTFLKMALQKAQHLSHNLHEL